VVVDVVDVDDDDDVDVDVDVDVVLYAYINNSIRKKDLLWRLNKKRTPITTNN
jgi:hypothetical protein